MVNCISTCREDKGVSFFPKKFSKSSERCRLVIPSSSLMVPDHFFWPGPPFWPKPCKLVGPDIPCLILVPVVQTLLLLLLDYCGWVGFGTMGWGEQVEGIRGGFAKSSSRKGRGRCRQDNSPHILVSLSQHQHCC